MTLKVGIIGVGGIAHTHMPGWASSEHTEVVAGSDINQTTLQEWGAKFNIQQLSTNPGDIIHDPDIDIIDIATPNAYHAAQTIAALEAGKHVLCEKPLAPAAAQILPMIDARDKAGKMLMTAQHHRFSNASRSLKREIDYGQLGEIYHARVWSLRRIAVPAKPTFLYREHSGGGVSIDMGVHLLDLSLWMMGHPEPVSVTGIARTELANRDGAFTIWGDNALLHKIDVQCGGAEWPDSKIMTTNYETQQTYTTKLGMVEDALPARALQCVEFAQAIVDGAPSPVPAEESLKVARVLDAIYESHKTGREVRLD